MALRVAERYPEQLRSLSLLEPGGPVGDADDAELHVRALATVMPRVLDRLRAGSVDDALEAFFEFVQGSDAWSQMTEGFRRMARDNAGTLLAQVAFEPVRKPISSAALKRISAPALLVGGSKSPPMFAHVLDVLEQLLPDVRRVTIPNASHAMNIQNPERFNDVIAGFLAETE